MTKKNPINVPLNAFSSVAGIYGWYLSAAKDSLSYWIMIVLTFLYIAYVIFEYVMPRSFKWINTVIFKRILKYGLMTILVFVSIFLSIYLISPSFAKSNETIVSIYNSEKLEEVQQVKPIENKSEFQTWNEIIDGKDSCNVTPLIVKEIVGITEENARDFLSSLPHLNNRQRSSNNRGRDTPYLYWHTYISRETWNKKEEYMQEVNGSKANYNQRMKSLDKAREDYANNFYVKQVEGYKKNAFKNFNIGPDAPYIVLYHEYKDSIKNIRYEKRFKTFQVNEYHTFMFRKSELEKYLNKDL